MSEPQWTELGHTDEQAVFNELLGVAREGLPPGFTGELTLTYADEEGRHTLAEIVKT